MHEHTLGQPGVLFLPGDGCAPKPAFISQCGIQVDNLVPGYGHEQYAGNVFSSPEVQ